MGKKPTVFQALDKAIRGDWGKDTTITPHVNSYDMSKLGKDVIYKTTNKDDYEQKKLELQQNKFLKDRWVKANVNMSVTAYAGLNNIKLMYRDADLMDAYPEIGAALDIVAEESTIPFPDNGQVVHVASKSERVKMVLEDLFVNRLNLQLTSPMVIRAMAKYGNQFMLLNIDRKDGVLGWRQMPVFNVERIENGIQNPYSTGVSLAVNSNDLDKVDLSTQFIWLDDNNSQVPFREWQVAHFRLLTNSLYLPYGVSYLNAARRHWRQLSLMEDMLLIYRLERSMERRVYKIFVGAIDDADIPAYIESVANEFKRTPIVDPMTGQIDLRKNILPVHKDTPIPLLDGRAITIEQLAREYEEGKENYVYSVQKDTLQIVGGKVVWCGKNYTADKLVKITLDDDTYTVMAPEHEVIMRDGSKKRADLLQEGESVMPLYRRDKLITSNSNLDYEQVYNPNNGKYEFTHRLVGKELLGESKREVIHHKDFNRRNNSPLNLQWMGWKEHRDYHVSLNSSERTRKMRRAYGLKVGYRKDFEEYNHSDLHNEHNAIRCIASKKSWDNENRERRIKQLSINVDNYVWDAIKIEIVNGRIYNRATLLDFANSNLIGHIMEINKNNKRLLNKKKISRKTFESALASIGYNTITEYLDAVAKKEGCALPSDIVRLRKRRIAYESGFNKHLLSNGSKKIVNENGDAKVIIDDIIWNDIRIKIINKDILTRKQLLDYINTKWIDYLVNHNTNTRFIKNKFVSETGLYWQVKHKYGMSVGEYIQSIKKNHKIKKIEWVSGDDVYCMTVVGPNGEDDRHNFAVCSINQDGSWNRNGIFVSNCYDQDIFIPVRDESAPTPIDTLSAGQNLTAIDDIKFVQNKVLTALRIPKTFLNFEENAGDGKNLALMDIRFTRVINRIQQAFLMELTRVAAIHLYLLGFNDDLTNFTLSMNNPSTQAEQLEIENTQKKIDAVRDAVSDPGNGMPVMSLTRALKEIMKWSEKDIKENFEQIRLEKGIAAELEKTAQIIKRTGIFDTVDRIYGEPGAEYAEDQQGQGGMGDEGGGPMGSGGSMGAPMDDGGGELDNLGAPGADDSGDISGQEGMTDTQDMPTDSEQPMEGKKTLKQVLTEENKVLDNMFESYLRKVHEQKMEKNNPTVERVKSYDEDSLLISEEFDKMIDALGKFVQEDEKE